MLKVFLVVCPLLLFIMTFSDGCLISPDKEFIYADTLYADTLTIRDTVNIVDTITVLDTVTVHDTIHSVDTITVLDTVTVHDTIHLRDTLRDTIRTFATNTPSASLIGVWMGNIDGESITLSIFDGTGDNLYGYLYDFTANIGNQAYDGYIKTVTGNIAAVDISGPGAYGENGSWIFSISNNVLTLQQTGYKMFPTMQSFDLQRIQ